jgi:signal transduction histidine kinase
MRKRHVPLLVLRVADLERIAWREGKVSARRFERRARDAFVKITNEAMRAADLPVHDAGSELFSIALATGSRDDGGNASATGCRSALARATKELSRILPVSLEGGWTLLSGVAPHGAAFEATLRTALRRGALERQRYEFFAGVAHEMRTPLTAIRGYLETLLDQTQHPQKARRFLEIARNETLRLGRLIDGMFEVSLLDIEPRDAEAPSHTRDATAVELAVEAALDALGPRIADRRAHVIVRRLPEQAVAMTFDHLVQVLVNVIGNALDHGRNEGQIAIWATSDPCAVVLRIEDDGAGIPVGEREAIFTFGYRARSEGAGLGLAVVRRLVERVGGAVYAADSTLGGAQIVISLPRTGSA